MGLGTCSSPVTTVPLSRLRQRSEAYPYPLYRHPPEWDPKGTYLTRQQIDEDGGLEGLGLEIAWTADRMSNFFLHVQGSGYVQFKDGERILLAYGGKNGHQYTSIGRLLVERGAISKSEISMQAIKAWAEKHPEQVSELLYQCESYTFFRTGPVGPIGAGRRGRRVASVRCSGPESHSSWALFYSQRFLN